MDFFKVTIISILCLLIYSCDTVPRKEYEELETRHQILKEASKSTDIKVVQQYKDINTIFSKIESVSGNLIFARKNIEGINYSQVEKINIHIESISKELEDLRNSANEKTNPELFKTIEHLQDVIVSKQNEIDLLKGDIRKKDVKIHDQGKTIEEQQQEINKQQQEIDKQLQKIEEQRVKIEQQQAQQWYAMGLLLYNTSTDLKEGKKVILKLDRGNGNKIIENKKKILSESKKCFEEAKKMGVEDSQKHITKINEELRNL